MHAPRSLIKLADQQLRRIMTAFTLRWSQHIPSGIGKRARRYAERTKSVRPITRRWSGVPVPTTSTRAFAEHSVRFGVGSALAFLGGVGVGLGGVNVTT